MKILVKLGKKNKGGMTGTATDPYGAVDTMRRNVLLSTYDQTQEKARGAQEKEGSAQAASQAAAAIVRLLQM